MPKYVFIWPDRCILMLVSFRDIGAFSSLSSQQALPREFYLACSLARLEAAFGKAQPLPLAELDLVLVRVPGARAVVREVHAREGVGAQILVARR